MSQSKLKNVSEFFENEKNSKSPCFEVEEIDQKSLQAIVKLVEQIKNKKKVDGENTDTKKKKILLLLNKKKKGPRKSSISTVKRKNSKSEKEKINKDDELNKSQNANSFYHPCYGLDNNTHETYGGFADSINGSKNFLDCNAPINNLDYHRWSLTQLPNLNYQRPQINPFQSFNNDQSSFIDLKNTSNFLNANYENILRLENSGSLGRRTSCNENLSNINHATPINPGLLPEWVCICKQIFKK